MGKKLVRKTAKKKLAKQVQEEADKPVRGCKFKASELLSSGSTTLNLAMSDAPFGGFRKGSMINIVGESQSGKTALALTLLAEGAVGDEFKEYKVIYDEPEAADEFDKDRMFGPKLVERLEAPAYTDDGRPLPSETPEDFLLNISKFLKKKVPFIYILDSFDSLTSEAEETQIENLLEGKDGKGSYGAEKAKASSKTLRNIVRKIEQTNSILIIISQTRDNIGSRFGGKTRSGGNALTFYSSHMLWINKLAPVTATVNGVKFKIGTHVKVDVRKNKLTGKERTVEFDIYYDYGIDNIGSCIDYMIGTGAWKGGKTGTKIDAKGIGIKATKKKLIKHIEENNMERRLNGLVHRQWHMIEKSLMLNRKPKYS